MATCSITDNITVNNPLLIIEYAEAMERLAETREPFDYAAEDVVVHDPDVIRSIFSKEKKAEEESCQ